MACISCSGKSSGTIKTQQVAAQTTTARITTFRTPTPLSTMYCPYTTTLLKRTYGYCPPHWNGQERGQGRGLVNHHIIHSHRRHSHNRRTCTIHPLPPQCPVYLRPRETMKTSHQCHRSTVADTPCRPCPAIRTVWPCLAIHLHHPRMHTWDLIPFVRNIQTCHPWATLHRCDPTRCTMQLCSGHHRPRPHRRHGLRHVRTTLEEYRCTDKCRCTVCHRTIQPGQQHTRVRIDRPV